MGFSRINLRRYQANPIFSLVAVVGLIWLGFYPKLCAEGPVNTCSESELRSAAEKGGTVLLTCDTLIALTDTLVITTNLTLDGTGHSGGLTGNGATNSASLIQVQPGVILTLRNLIIASSQVVGADGANAKSGVSAVGGAIYNLRGTVRLEGCTLSAHTLKGGAGSVALNSSQDGGKGGEAAGAALFNDGGEIFATNTLFAGNSALGGLGGAGAAGASAGNGSNGGNGGQGGRAMGAALYNAANGRVAIFNSSFASNVVTSSSGGAGGAGGGTLGFPGNNGRASDALGAAFFNESGTVTLVNTSFIGNGGTGAAGLNGAVGTGTVPGTTGGNGGHALGGGLCVQSGILALTNCAFSGNVLTAGAGGSGGSGRTGAFGTNGRAGGNGGSAQGGGIYAGSDGAIWIVNCTFASATLTSGAPGIGGTGNALGSDGDTGSPGNNAGAAIFNPGGVVQIKNSILAASSSVSNASGPFSDAGFNLSSDSTPTLASDGSRNLVDPLLGSTVQAAGQSTSILLQTGSPAINAITRLGGNGGPLYDQRNALRVEPGDIGAYESDGVFASLTLRAVPLSKQVVLSWPAFGEPALQTAAEFTTPSQWQAVLDQPITSQGIRTLVVSPSGQTRFYRLIQP